MVPEMADRNEEWDERLIEARDEVLLAGERVVAQESGDQGQGIVLTDSRIIVIKAGITATGSLNGRRVGVYPLGQIESVLVRKGPMGAVIQVRGNGTTPPSSGERPPENVIVFSGAEKMKRCESIAAKIEAAMGKPLNRVDPKSEPVAAAKPIVEAPKEPEAAAPAELAQAESVIAEAVQAVEAAKPVKKPRGGRVAKTLAEEMFEEANAPQPVAGTPLVEQAAPAVSAPVPEPVVESPKPVEIPVAEPVMVAQAAPEPEPEPAPVVPEFGPNPRLPKPVRAKAAGPNKLLVVFGSLAVVVLLGIAITAPLRQQDPSLKNPTKIDVKAPDASAVRLRLSEIIDYRKSALNIMQESECAMPAAKSALGGANAQVLSSAIAATSSSLEQLRALRVPPGLAGAQESLIGALFARKGALEAAATAGTPADETMRKLSEADTQIADGLAAMDRLQNELQSQLSPKSSPRK